MKHTELHEEAILGWRCIQDRSLRESEIGNLIMLNNVCILNFACTFGGVSKIAC